MTGVSHQAVAMSVGAAPFRFAFIPSSNLGIATDLTTYTFASAPLGDPHPTREIVVCITSRAAGNRSISSVSVGGISASEIIQVRNSGSGNSTLCAIYRAAVPSGTAGDVVVTHSAGIVRCGIALYRMINAAPGQTDTISNETGTTGTINIPARGAAVAVAYSNLNATATWTGLAEDHESIVEGCGYSSASDTFPAAQTGRTVTCSWSSTSVPAMVAASFGP